MSEVYVGELTNGRAVLYAHDIHELKNFAWRAGIDKSKLVPQSGFYHYSIGSHDRQTAVGFGASPVTPIKMMVLVKGKRDPRNYR